MCGSFADGGNLSRERASRREHMRRVPVAVARECQPLPDSSRFVRGFLRRAVYEESRAAARTLREPARKQEARRRCRLELGWVY